MITRRRISCSVLVGLGIVCVMIVFALAVSSRGVRWWEFGYYEKPVWSPNGEKVLFLFSKRPSDHPTLTVVERTSAVFFSQAQELQLPARRLSSPAWRSNVEVSVFSERFSGFGTDLRAEPATLYLYDISSETWEAFEAPLPFAFGIGWHPDGNYALVSLGNHSTNSQGEIQAGIYKFTPDSGKFELWFEAESPGSIAWSRDGSYVAFLEFVPVGSENPVHLNLVDVTTEERAVFQQLSMKSDARSWTVRGDTGLSWSKNGDQLIVNGTLIEYRNHRDYDVHDGFFFISVDDPEQFVFWESSSKPIHFDVSPSGEEIVFTAITQRLAVKTACTSSVCPSVSSRLVQLTVEVF